MDHIIIPTGVFVVSPYDQSNIPDNYSGSSTILNVDTSSLASDDTPQYEGYIAQGMILRGEVQEQEQELLMLD